MEDRHHDVLAVAVLFTILTWFTVSLRIYVRALMLKTFGIDDWTIIFAQLVFSLYLACQYGGLAYGTGRHIRDLEPSNAREALKYWWICELFYVQSTCWAKIAVGLFLLRLAVSRVHRWLIYALMIGDIIFCQTFFFIVLLQCRPMSAFWERSYPDLTGRCMEATVIINVTYAASAVNAIADWSFAIIPIFMIKDVQMRTNSKILISGVLSLGAIASIATIIRIPYLKQLDRLDDFLWATTDVAIWSTVEPGLGITATSVAALRPLLRRYFAAHFDSTRARTPSHHKLSTAVSNPRSKLSRSGGTALHDFDKDDRSRDGFSSHATSEHTSGTWPSRGKLGTIWVDESVIVESTERYGHDEYFHGK